MYKRVCKLKRMKRNEEMSFKTLLKVLEMIQWIKMFPINLDESKPSKESMVGGLHLTVRI